MDRVIYSLSTFAAVFCAVVVGTVLLSLSGIYEIHALVAYGFAGLLGVAAAREVFRASRPRRWSGTSRA